MKSIAAEPVPASNGSRCVPTDYVERFTILAESANLHVSDMTLRQLLEWSESVGAITFRNEPSVRESLRYGRAPFQCLDFCVVGRLSVNALLQHIVAGLRPLKAHVAAVCLHCYREGEELRVPVGRSREQLWPMPRG